MSMPGAVHAPIAGLAGHFQLGHQDVAEVLAFDRFEHVAGLVRLLPEDGIPEGRRCRWPRALRF